MKVQGNTKPILISIEPYANDTTMSEVRVRANVEGVDVNLYEYDEYVFYMTTIDNIEEYVTENYDSYIASGKALEDALPQNQMIMFKEKTENAIAETNDGLIETYEATLTNEQTISECENALMELYEMIVEG